jgi:hypothetical protein
MTRDEKVLEVLGTVASLTPVLGGPLSSILFGISGDRRFGRASEVVLGLAERVGTLETEQEEFVRSEDFEDLLIETLQRAAAERNEDLRRSYQNILMHAIRDPDRSYDETLRFLRVLEQLQADHVRVLRALLEEPRTQQEVSFGSPRQTLKKRLPDIADGLLDDLVSQLNDLRVTNAPSLGTLMTGKGASFLRAYVTPFGNRFVEYLSEPVEGDASHEG